MKLPPRPRRIASSGHHAEDGYILIILILFVALLAIGLSIVVPEITQQIKRDREEELIHRGVQYSRAIKHYVKKFGRYPTRIEELEDTNNMRFLRKRYKDPVTGKDFKILHLGDVQMGFAGGIAGATSASAMTGGAPGNPSGGFGNSTFGGGNSAFGGNSGNGAFGGGSGNSAFGGGNSAFGGGGGFGNGAFGGSTGGLGGNPGGLGGNSAFGGNAAGGNPTGAAPGTDAAAPGADASQTAAGTTPDQTAQGATGAQPGAGQPGAAPGTAPRQGNQQVFGGGPMVGVVSTSKDKTIRVFSKKEHYNEWQFIYDPSTDRGGLLTTPNQPGMQSAVAPTVQGASGVQGGAPGGTQSSPFGSQSSSFGFSGGQQQPGGIQPTQQQQPQSQFPPDQGP
jgi:type II secretory pathway pseudopilin PulG